ncbi:hypothetical protein NKG94_40420 [Micromonospora sp. M12]
MIGSAVASDAIRMTAGFVAGNGPAISSMIASAVARAGLGVAAGFVAGSGPAISSPVRVYESSPHLWTPLETGLTDVGPGLGEVWVEYSREIGLWLVRPSVKLAGIAAAIYFFTAWYLSFKAANPQAAEEFRTSSSESSFCF